MKSCLVVVGTALAVESLTATLALACGGLPVGQYSVAANQPLADAEGVALDQPLAFRVDCKAEQPELAWAICANGQSLLDVALRKLGGDAVVAMGSTQPFGDVQVWRPPTGLEADATYQVTVTLGANTSPSQDAVVEQTLQFTTGAQRLPSLSARALRLEAETYEARAALCDGREVVGDAAEDALSTQNICPTGYGNCEEIEPREHVRVALRFDGIEGGYAATGYELRLMMTDETPGDFGALPDGEDESPWANDSHDLLFGTASWTESDVPGLLALDLMRPERQDGSTTVCVRPLIVDAAGERAGLEPICQTYEAWMGAFAPRDVDADAAGSDAGASADGVAEAGTHAEDSPAAGEGGGCRASDAGGPATLGWLGWLLVLPLRARKRKPGVRVRVFG